MVDAEYLNGIATHTVDNPIGLLWDNEFSRLRPPAYPAHVWKAGQVLYGRIDQLTSFFSSGGILQTNEFTHLMKIEYRQL